MASTIQLKTGTGSAVPSSLTQGELAINITNGLVYYGSGSGNTVKQLESFTNITASANISASGYLYGSKAIIDRMEHNDSVSNIYFANGIYVAGGNHITASGIISASGNIINTGNVTSDGTGSFGRIHSTTDISASGNIINTGNLTTSIITSTGISASGNISASGYLVAQNITASANISASGYIYGRQFEQLESVCSAVNLNTSLIYVPLGGQSLLEQAVNTNANIQKLAIATGKPRKVIMRNMIGGGIKFGNTGFTCSYWSAPPLTGIISLIGEKYANGISASHEAITFDFTETDINFSGSWSDVTPGSKVYMSLKADIALPPHVNPISSLGVASLWEWDYNA